MSIDEWHTDVLLSKYCTFGIGGPAKFFCTVRTIKEMQAIFIEMKCVKIPFFILGKGSNTLFDDRGYNGLVIANRIDLLEKLSEEEWYVGAGYSFSLLGTQTARQGWTGLEFASGIPGSVGGAVYMNAGANGIDTAAVLVSVDYVNESGELIRYNREELNFGNRYSSFQDLQGAIVAATFRLKPFESAREKQLQLFNARKQTQPYDAKSAGCVFKNPFPSHAGALIDRLEMKGLRVGGAEVSTLHANFIINFASAKAEDVKQLIQLIKAKVKENTGIELETEVRYIPFEEI